MAGDSADEFSAAWGKDSSNGSISGALPGAKRGREGISPEIRHITEVQGVA